MPDQKVAMIGDGNVGSALTEGLTRAGYEVRAAGKEPGLVKELGSWGDIIVLAIPYSERQNAVREIGADILRGKTVIDVTNALNAEGGYAGDLQRSGAEELQSWIPGAHVVKAFNTVFAQNMSTGQVHGEPLSAFVAADNEGAKQRVVELAGAIGFDGVDAGQLENARWLEALGMLNIQLGYKVGHGPATGIHFVHEGGASAQKSARSAAGTRRRAV